MSKAFQPTQEMLASVRILVADDDAMVRDILVQHLKNFGFGRIIETKDGQAALRIVQDNKEMLDLVISDWEMPKATGLTLLKAVRQNPGRQNCKFLMVTSQVSRERAKISQAALWSVDAYLIKPFRAEVFRQKIFELLGWVKPSHDSGERDAQGA